MLPTLASCIPIPAHQLAAGNCWSQQVSCTILHISHLVILMNHNLRLMHFFVDYRTNDLFILIGNVKRIKETKFKLNFPLAFALKVVDISYASMMLATIMG